MWNIFEQPWTGLAIAVIVFNVVAVVRWFVPLERKWQFIPSAAIAISALALCYLIDTDRELVRRVMSQAFDAVSRQNADDIAGLISPDYSDSRHPDRNALMQAWRRWLAEVKIDHVGTSDTFYDLTDGKATVTFRWLVKFGTAPGQRSELNGYVIFGQARVSLVETPRRHWLVRSSELLELMNHPTSWQRVDF